MGILLWCVTGLLVAALLVAAAGFSRLRAVSGLPSSFESAHRPSNPEATGDWHAGFAVYREDRLVWWRSWSLWPRPQRQWLRESLRVDGRTASRGPLEDLWVVHCRDGDSSFDLTMSGGAYAGLASWLESAPPARRYPHV